MKNHVDNLLRLVPDLLSQEIVDIGSGKGAFLLELARRGTSAIGIEPTLDYIELSRTRAQAQGQTLDVREGTAEHIPLPDASVDFVNIGEVIEHVEDPDQMLTEVSRILRPQGKAYLSVPNRFGLRDQHFHLYVINWMPRSWAHALIGMLGRHKDYSGKAGRQSLRDMHYYTYGAIQKFCREKGFAVTDIRILKIKRVYGPLSFFLLPLYKVLRAFYFDSFHLLLEKP
jgi:2-polyprenyl-3-methyl-5-hydroxy-6-metoxy-1,4-benzoquinol methylase